MALRTRAIVLLAMDSGLRVNECVQLDLWQVLEDPTAQRVRLQSQFYLYPAQAKRGAGGLVSVTERASSALREWILAIRRDGWIDWPPPSGTPLFLGHRGHRGRAGHARLTVRSAQHCWHVAQERARLHGRYTFHDLRHDAASRLRAAGADVFDLAEAMRWRRVDVAQRYVHTFDARRRAGALAKAASKV